MEYLGAFQRDTLHVISDLGDSPHGQAVKRRIRARRNWEAARLDSSEES